jgi:hypothetical protein
MSGVGGDVMAKSGGFAGYYGTARNDGSDATWSLYLGSWCVPAGEKNLTEKNFSDFCDAVRASAKRNACGNPEHIEKVAVQISKKTVMEIWF